MVTFPEEILNGKLHFLCSESIKRSDGVYDLKTFRITQFFTEFFTNMRPKSYLKSVSKCILILVVMSCFTNRAIITARACKLVENKILQIHGQWFFNAKEICNFKRQKDNFNISTFTNIYSFQ